MHPAREKAWPSFCRASWPYPWDAPGLLPDCSRFPPWLLLVLDQDEQGVGQIVADLGWRLAAGRGAIPFFTEKPRADAGAWGRGALGFMQFSRSRLCPGRLCFTRGKSPLQPCHIPSLARCGFVKQQP